MKLRTRILLILAALVVAELLTFYATSLVWLRSVQPGVQRGFVTDALWLTFLAAMPLELVLAGFLIFRAAQRSSTNVP